MKTPETTFQEWREQFAKQREELFAKREEIDQQIDAIDRELAAITAYEQVKRGKPLQKERTRSPSTRAPRGARAEIRAKILDFLKDLSEGATAEAINAELQATDPKEKQKIANVLSLMKGEGLLSQEARHGPYKVAA